jgi:hypothetical protein
VTVLCNVKRLLQKFFLALVRKLGAFCRLFPRRCLSSPMTAIAPTSTKPDDTSEAVSWWLWISWLEREGHSNFVFGCAARTFHATGWTDDATFEIPGGGLLITHQCIVTEEVFNRFLSELSAGTVDVSVLLPSKTVRAQVKATRTILQASLGQSAVRTLLHYTLPSVETLLGKADGALEGVLFILQEQLNLPFKDAYAGHLGNFEIFELHPWLDKPQPFLIETIPDPDLNRSGPQIMEICRTAEFAANAHTAHLVGRVNDGVVLDRLVSMPSGDRRISVQVPERLDQFEFRIFSEDGQTLIHSEKSHFMNRIGLVMAPIGRQMTIEDDLSTRAKGSGAALASAASTVVVHSSHRSEIGAPAIGTWRKFAEDMEDAAARSMPKASEDKWFPRGIEGEVGAIAHLNRIIDGGQITRAVLVDPWFGADTLSRFVLRLGSQGVQLAIVTSWTDIDPDTGTQLDQAESSTAQLETALRQLAPFLNQRLTLLNVVDGRDRAFHDRYLLVYPHEHSAKVFLLSNSFNKLAGNWPFAMSLLAPDVSREVQRYIEGLCDGRDDARNRSLTVSFRWPLNAA